MTREPHYCPYCPLCYYSKGALTQHLKREHPQEWEQLQNENTNKTTDSA